jgi:hypothetical protein
MKDKVQVNKKVPVEKTGKCGISKELKQKPPLSRTLKIFEARHSGLHL